MPRSTGAAGGGDQAVPPWQTDNSYEEVIGSIQSIIYVFVDVNVCDDFWKVQMNSSPKKEFT